jgi:hypothetical protein
MENTDKIAGSARDMRHMCCVTFLLFLFSDDVEEATRLPVGNDKGNGLP